MTKLTIEYSKPRKDGTRKVMFRLVARGTQKHIPTNIELSRNDYVVLGGSSVNVTNRTKLHDIMQSMVTMEGAVMDIESGNMSREYTAKELASLVSTEGLRKKDSPDFFEFAEDWLSRTDIRGKKNYVTMLNSLQKFNGGLRVLPFDMMTYSFLNRYMIHLNGRKRAQSLYLGAIRHIYKEAALFYNDDRNAVIYEGLFDRFKVPRQVQAGQRSLYLDEIRRFFSFEPKSGTRQELALDCCKLSFCLMGTNSVDLYNASSFRNGIFSYDRTKTKGRRHDRAHIEIRVHDTILPLFERYRGSCGRVFSFSSRYADESQFNRAINIGLKEIGTELEIPHLQFYRFRHSLASIARNELGFPKSDIDEMLNHVGDMRLADIYIKKDFRVINELNFKVIDYVFGSSSL